MHEQLLDLVIRQGDTVVCEPDMTLGDALALAADVATFIAGDGAAFVPGEDKSALFVGERTLEYRDVRIALIPTNQV